MSIGDCTNLEVDYTSVMTITSPNPNDFGDELGSSMKESLDKFKKDILSKHDAIDVTVKPHAVSTSVTFVPPTQSFLLVCVFIFKGYLKVRAKSLEDGANNE